ncbi:hypothetical protein [Kamptonema formosum]|uniref:hypothetical protein n=1 Tax=Kamptonema formosum TaxID=331992 RepID=UPI000347B827|nr:hypothetical protein [Oscillatoria sp. PCC 10802]
MSKTFNPQSPTQNPGIQNPKAKMPNPQSPMPKSGFFPNLPVILPARIALRRVASQAFFSPFNRRRVPVLLCLVSAGATPERFLAASPQANPFGCLTFSLSALPQIERRSRLEETKTGG